MRVRVDAPGQQRNQQAQQPTAPPARGSTSDRLAELQGIRDRGLITDEEHAEARRRILDSL